MFRQCSERTCAATAVSEGSSCLGHLDDIDLDNYLATARRDRLLDARGVVVTERLLDRIQKHQPSETEAPWRVRFDHATFTSEVGWGGSRFADESSFAEANFLEEPYFRGATFGDATSFRGTKFSRGANFQGTTFGTRTVFARSSFDGPLWLKRASFGELANFDGAHLGDSAYLRLTRFADGASFRHTVFGDSTFIGGRRTGGR
jgi:hypothetical protein